MSFFTAGETIRSLGLPQWLDMATDQDPHWGIDLPMIQRGFVWKPQQIIDLWDSLLSGMPIGALMVSEMTGPSVPLMSAATSRRTDSMAAQRLGLVDGQQRTLAMCMGWMPFAPDHSNHRLWVDLADKPPPGHQVRLRVTTRNQPFGFQRDNANNKLTLDQRRRARQACSAVAPGELLAHAVPHPAGASHSAPLDLGALVQQWRVLHGDTAAWQDWVRQELRNAPTLVLKDGLATLQPQWDNFPEEVQQLIEARLAMLVQGLQKIFATQIPLVRIDAALFQADSEDGAEPPLARLFRRVGSNATPLSDADYIYSVLKHQMPEIHDMVQALHDQDGVASLLTPTDLVMTALRLAAVDWKDANGKSAPDFPSPSKEDFHRLVMRPADFANPAAQQQEAGKRQADLRAVLGSSGEQSLARLFTLVQANVLRVAGAHDIGLPPLMLPHLGRPLVQVLLRLAQKGWLLPPVDVDYRNQALRLVLRTQALRLVLWWQRWVADKTKASRIAFAVIDASADALDIDRRIAQAVVEAGAGWAMQPPAAIAALGLDDSTRGESTPTLKDRARFATPESGTEGQRRTREFYYQWWQHWNHHHPLLLWLQRRYVCGLGDQALAGAIDDTPYDFDHILPSAHWSADWSYVRGSDDIPDFRDARKVLGNSIGNVRVWDAALNRSDGAASPRSKLHRQEQDEQADSSWLHDSAIDPAQHALWLACSPEDEAHPTRWNRQRALAFQQVVEQRAFALYQQLYQQADFAEWEGTASPIESA